MVMGEETPLSLSESAGTKAEWACADSLSLALTLSFSAGRRDNDAALALLPAPHSLTTWRHIPPLP